MVLAYQKEIKSAYFVHIKEGDPAISLPIRLNGYYVSQCYDMKTA